jgi:uncharacterized membrane protein YbaN (DUF454 family)
MKRYLLIVAGVASVCAGTAGLFIPLLPTTPFLLLALFCFARSSPRLHCWLMNHRIFGAHLTNYLKHRAIVLSIKVLSIAFLWCSLAVSMILVDNPYIRAAMMVIGIAVTVHLLSLRVITKGTRDVQVDEAEFVSPKPSSVAAKD